MNQELIAKFVEMIRVIKLCDEITGIKRVLIERVSIIREWYPQITIEDAQRIIDYYKENWED